MATETLSADEDQLERLASVLAHAIGVFGDSRKAVNWMKTPNPLLHHKTALSGLRTEEGAREVEVILTRIEHGVFS